MFDHWNTDRVHHFRTEAASRGLPTEEVEEWLQAIKPAVFWTFEGGDGPVAAWLGGDALLPEEVPTPTAPLAATVDCSLLPKDLGLPLPADGHLLFFAEPEVGSSDSKGGVVHYVPAGARTTVRPAELTEDTYPSRDLRMAWLGSSTPDEEPYVSAKWGDDLDFDEHNRATQLVAEMDEAWTSVGGSWPMWTFALGGNTIVLNWDPLDAARQDEPEDADDWILLATWRCDEEVERLDMGVMSWMIRRKDLASLRFDRAYLYVDM